MSEILQFLLLTSLFMALVWLISVIKKDASIVDRFWGLIFIFLSFIYLSSSNLTGWRVYVLFAMVTIWGGRLSLHIHLRNRGHREDIRYRRMRENVGESFWWQSLFRVFLLQGFLALLISAPLYCVFVLPSSIRFLWSDGLGVLLWTLGMVFEVGGDWQLKKFKSDPKNSGKLLTTGLWSLTRHPNYFGDACLWWGFFCFALSVPYGWLSAFGPIIMTLFLRYVSGVTLLEKDMKNTKPGYAEYVANTPAFFPRIFGGRNE